MSKKTSKVGNSYFRKYFFIILVLIVFVGIRLIHLPEVVRFGPDEGRDFLVAWNIYTEKEVTLIGPPSEFTINGRQFFFGPAPYYTILPALVIGNWDVLSVSYFLILINAAALLVVLLILDKYIKDKRILYSFGVITTFTAVFIEYAQSYWNPHFMLPVALLLLGLLIKSKDTKSLILFFLIGFLFGLGMQFHYSFIFAVIVGFLWLIANKRLSRCSMVCVFTGSIIGFLPVIVFEFRNNFYNIQTFLLVLNSSSTTMSGFRLTTFYLISIFPFVIYLISKILSKLKNDRLLYALLGLYAILSLAVVFAAPKPELNYPTQVKIASLINKDNPSNFNIVDQLTRDNRAMAVRFLLTVRGSKPQGITEYPQAKIIYIYSKLPLNALLKDPVWEIKSFLPYKKATTWNVNDDIFIYKLEK